MKYFGFYNYDNERIIREWVAFYDDFTAADYESAIAELASEFGPGEFREIGQKEWELECGGVFEDGHIVKYIKFEYNAGYAGTDDYEYIKFNYRVSISDLDFFLEERSNSHASSYEYLMMDEIDCDEDDDDYQEKFEAAQEAYYSSVSASAVPVSKEEWEENCGTIIEY